VKSSSDHRGLKALPKSQRGVALVITLLFLVVTTIIVVAFLVRSQSDYQASASYSASVQSEALAASAADQVIANFLAEIADPDNSTTHKLGNDLTWFEPKDKGGTFPSMIPEIATNFGGARNNLIKQSLASTPFYSNAQPVASSVKSSEGERPVSGRRWDLPRLLLDDSGLQAGDFDNSNVPDWIYVRENGETTTSPDENIVGRYAYNVYDVGGLLNVNVAGHETSAKAEDIALKGALAFADLTQIGLNGNAVDEIVAWRAPHVDWADIGNPDADISGSPLSILDFLRLGSNVGWMKNPAIDSTSGANQFLSRRDLLRFFEEKGFDSKLLPFLTHFSVDADAPTFSPDTEILLVNAKKPSGGAQPSKLLESRATDTVNPSDQKRINPPRFANDTLIGAYKLPNDKTVEAPVLFKRFPLSRLALVRTDPSARAAAGSTEELTQRYFGLVSGGDDYTWQYKDEEGETEHIKTLDEVAAANREPNFFEILKSVIQVGSLGQHRNPVRQDAKMSLEPQGNRVDDHILRIGAAIIDQADEDSYPTRIRFLYDQNSGLGEIYGVEDLPYIYAMKFTGFGKKDSPKQHYFIAQPVLWNPHNPQRRKDTTDVPEKFQIKPLKPNGPISIQMSSKGKDANNPGVSIANQFNQSTTISFDWKPNDENFRQPQTLLSKSYPLNANVQGGPGLAVHPKDNEVYAPLNPYSSATPVGFYIGQHGVDAGDDAQTVRYGSGTAQFQLQYRAPNGAYYTYDRLWFTPEAVKASDHKDHPATPTFGSLFSGREDPRNPSKLRSEAIYQKSDPRSQRFIWTSDLMYFCGFSADTSFRYALAEGTGPGWYRGIFSKINGGGDREPTGWDESKDYVDLWKFGNQKNPSNDRKLRIDMGHLSINRDVEQLGGWGFYYSDHDGVIRRAMAGGMSNAVLKSLAEGSPPSDQSLSAQMNPSSPDRPLPMQANALDLANKKDLAKNFYHSRPIVLNRPFRSVGELAYTFRDVPWKNIDFAFSESGDTGLLDVFTIYENEGQADSATPLVAGKVNLNTAPKPVLKALLAGTAKYLPTDSSNTFEDLDEIDSLTERLVEYRSTAGSPNTSENGVNGPLRSLAELVGRVYSSGKSDFGEASFVGLHPEQVASGEDAVKGERISAVTRALADVGTTRTWNVMIDLVAQSGRIPKDRQLQDFSVSSESRWWVFVSIDRFTGKILAHSVERIVE